jgi:hypothetical protein
MPPIKEEKRGDVHMISGLGSITLWRVEVRDPKRWIVKNTFLADITHVRRNNDVTVRLVANIQHRSYVCVRPSDPGSLEELKDSQWSDLLSGRSLGSPGVILVEAVIAFNVSRLLGMRPNQLLFDGAVRTAAIPHQHNAYCGTHDRAHY